MKVFIQVIDTKTGIYQYGMIEEPIDIKFQVLNALKHFGIDCVDWVAHEMSFLDGKCEYDIGIICGTSKIVSIVCVS